MRKAPPLARVGALVGDPARATMLGALLDGRPLTATELATRAGVTASTASAHLGKLVAGGLVVVERRGRFRLFRVADRRVARALESLGGLGRPSPPRDDAFRFARACYDHLAGRLGVAVERALVVRRLLVEDGSSYGVTDAGAAWLSRFGVDLAAVRAARRSLARPCLDWSERRPHVAGALGQALLSRLLERRWLLRRDEDRTLDLSEAGRRGMSRELGIERSRSDLHATFTNSP